MYLIEVMPSGGTTLTPKQPRIVARGDMMLMVALFPVLVQQGTHDWVIVYGPPDFEVVAEWHHNEVPSRV